MSYCSKCSKAIHSIKYCNFCKDEFCSSSCLEHHINYYHLSGQNQKKPKSNRIRNNNNNNHNNNIYNNNDFVKISDYFFSPYLTKGTMLLTKPVFDKTYSLNNFEPVIENGKQKVIGSGSYGKVFLAINKIDKKYYAIKRMQKKNLIKALKTLKGIYNEIDIQSRINHKNIVKLYYVKESKDAFDLVMEYARYGNLYLYIKKNSYLSEEKSFKYFIQVVNAIYFLHKNDLIHRDIKPENILMFNDGIVKLCDFGWCARLDGGQRITFCGTVEYMSPEMVNKEEYSKEIDIWSLGILLYEMTHGYSPFKPDKAKFNIYDVIDNIKIKDLKFANEISKECKELIIHLLDRDITKRYKVEDIFSSNFVKFYENKDKINKIKSKDEKNDIYINNIEKEKPIENNNNIIIKEIKDTKENDKKVDDIKNKINIGESQENILIEKEFQNIKSKAKNNTARNFYPNITEKEIIDINKKKNKYSSNCKVKNTQNKFENNKGITERVMSHNNINNYFKNTKRNVKEKSKNKANSTFDLLKEMSNEEMKYQSENRKKIYNNNRRIKSSNSSLTNSIVKKSGQKAKNRQISVENKTNNLIKDIIEETNEMNFFDKKINYTNRLRTRNSCENFIQGKIALKSQEYMNKKDNEKKVQKLIDNVNDNIKNIFKDNITKKKTATKVKIKNIQNEINNNDEIKINIDNDNTVKTKRNTKVKNYYLSGGGIHNLLKNNKKNNYNSSSSPQINIINNNPIFNNNIINYSTYILNDKNNKSKVENDKKDDIIKNFAYKKKSPNHGIILLVHNDGNKQNYCPIKSRLNKDNNSTQSNNLSIQDLDETPKKYIDNVKINPQELLENFSKELNCYLSKK